MLKELIYKTAKNKSVLILGFGKEGQSTYKLLRELFPDQVLTIADRNENLVNNTQLSLKDNNLELLLGEEYLSKIDYFDLIIKSPGISFGKTKTDKAKNNITSQSDLFIRAYSDQIIGITGTKGKSTTASLIYHILKYDSRNVVLSGNIGIPPFEVYNNIDHDTKIVLELSAHQLEHITKSPHTSVILNIYPEHLDHFDSFENYRASKLNIALYQSSGDKLIFPKEDNEFESLLQAVQGRDIYKYSVATKVEQGCYIDNEIITFSERDGNQRSLLSKTELPLAGEHNLLNIMAVINVCSLEGLEIYKISSALETFSPLEHRLEFAGVFKGIKFYNDSISTIPESTIFALKSIKGVNSIILGGFDRGISYEKLINYISSSEVENIILTGAVGRRLEEELNGFTQQHQTIYYSDDFSEAIRIAIVTTKKGSTCIFSPAAASYDKFKNFEERGTLFKKLISKI